MSISREDVIRVARLARLEPGEAEIEALTRDLDAILDFVARARGAGGGPAEAGAPPPMPLREDRVEPWPRSGALPEEYRVPPVLGGD